MREKLTAERLKNVVTLLDEALLTIEGNLEDERFDPMAAREVTVKVKIQRDKKDPGLVDVVCSAKLKLPDRLGKVNHGVIRDGEILLERYPEDGSLFDNLEGAKKPVMFSSLKNEDLKETQHAERSA
jgi:hypothetical protein